MSAEWDAITRQAWDAVVDAAQRRHPSALGPVRESELVFTARDEAELSRLLNADLQKNPLPPNWQAWADNEPIEHPIPDPFAAALLVTLAVLLPWVGIIAAVRWLVA